MFGSSLCKDHRNVLVNISNEITIKPPSLHLHSRQMQKHTITFDTCNLSTWRVCKVSYYAYAVTKVFVVECSLNICLFQIPLLIIQQLHVQDIHTIIVLVILPIYQQISFDPCNRMNVKQ